MFLAPAHGLLSIAKLQNLKAIHNVIYQVKKGFLVVINRKTTKFESNSQLCRAQGDFTISCYQSQNYKIWKQFTTYISISRLHFRLLSIAKLQNLKAIHNVLAYHYHCLLVVINRKTTKFESNSQRKLHLGDPALGCYQSQNYKIWKQFTTKELKKQAYTMLLSIAKLQNLKAIHNATSHECLSHFVVINRKTTKFESNSQPLFGWSVWSMSCYQSQNYKIWKQFTTTKFREDY